MMNIQTLKSFIKECEHIKFKDLVKNMKTSNLIYHYLFSTDKEAKEISEKELKKRNVIK
jgi:hypothetical protein